MELAEIQYKINYNGMLNGCVKMLINAISWFFTQPNKKYERGENENVKPN